MPIKETIQLSIYTYLISVTIILIKNNRSGPQSHTEGKNLICKKLFSYLEAIVSRDAIDHAAVFLLDGTIPTQWPHANTKPIRPVTETPKNNAKKR